MTQKIIFVQAVKVPDWFCHFNKQRLDDYFFVFAAPALNKGGVGIPPPENALLPVDSGLG